MTPEFARVLVDNPQCVFEDPDAVIEAWACLKMARGQRVDRHRLYEQAAIMKEATEIIRAWEQLRVEVTAPRRHSKWQTQIATGMDRAGKLLMRRLLRSQPGDAPNDGGDAA